jgi:hypothetical protein
MERYEILKLQIYYIIYLCLFICCVQIKGKTKISDKKKLSYCTSVCCVALLLTDIIKCVLNVYPQCCCLLMFMIDGLIGKIRCARNYMACATWH